MKSRRLFTVMTFNIHKGKHPIWRKETLTPLRNFIASHNVDLIFIQEIVGSDPKNNLFDQVAYLGEGLKSDFCYGKNAIVRDYHHGNAILSRFPILSWKNIDLTTNSFEKRGMLQAEIDLGNNLRTKAFCCHLNLMRKSRRAQIEKISRELDKSAKNFSGPLFAGGDFNDWMKDASRPLFEKGWKEAGFDGKGKEHFLTFPAWWPRMALDRLYYRSAELKKAEVIPFGEFGTLSDHLPILAEFDLSHRTDNSGDF